MFRLGTFVWEHLFGKFVWDLSFGNFRLWSFAWELSLGYFAWMLPPEVSGFETFAWELSFRIFRLGTFAWNLSLGRCFVWELSFRIFRLGIFARDLSPGNFGFRSSASKPSTGNLCLGSLVWEPLCVSCQIIYLVPPQCPRDSHIFTTREMLTDSTRTTKTYRASSHDVTAREIHRRLGGV